MWVVVVLSSSRRSVEPKAGEMVRRGYYVWQWDVLTNFLFLIFIG